MNTIAPSIFAGLNQEQTEAVETLRGPLLILAGAGSGKTRTLTHRIAHLIAKGIPAWQILAVTFTNKAASELKERIGRMLHIATGDGLMSSFEFEGGKSQNNSPALPVSGTFHSICARILRRDIEHLGRSRSFVIYDTDDQEKLMQQVLRDMHITPEELKPRAALSKISSFKSEAVAATTVLSRASTHLEYKMAELYQLYAKKLLENNALDFDDLLLETVRLFIECPEVLKRYQQTWQFIHVDEYQDTNHVQYLFVSLLAKAHQNLCVIGDPDQSIYAFRGADIRNILDFQKEYPEAKSIKLEQNYRSTQQILDAADGVISANPNRPDKKMWSEKKDGEKIILQEVMDERRESEEVVRHAITKRGSGIPLAEQAILYRTNAQSRLFEEACLRAGIPYRIIGGVKFYARREVKDLLAYLYASINNTDTVSVLRIINVPARKIGDTTLARLQNFCNERGITLWQAMKHIEMVEGIAPPAQRRIAEFSALIEESSRLTETAPVSTVAQWIIDKTGMERWIRDGTDEGEERWQNVQELLTVTRKYDSLPPQESITNFLEEVALVSEVDKLKEGKDALTLMTLHLCKGLEFESVALVGCEEGLLPHSSSQYDRAQLEEERRLLYVGMTRAKKHLALFHTMSRSLWGKVQSNPRSRFLDDIPHTVAEARSDTLQSKYAWLTEKRPTSVSTFTESIPRPMQINEFNQESENDWLEHVEELIHEGTRIEHRTLGFGTVLQRSGDIVEVRFDAGSLKKLALGVAPIKLARD